MRGCAGRCPGSACTTPSSATPSRHCSRGCTRSAPASRSRRSPSSRLLAALGIDARDVLYSNPVKPPAHDRRRAGARASTASRRTRAASSRSSQRTRPARASTSASTRRDATSRVPLAGKFGVDPATAVALLVEARTLGLVPHGLTFHVGSQTLDPRAYARAIELAGAVLRAAAHAGAAARAARHRRRPAGPLHRAGPAARGVSGARSQMPLARLPYPIEVVAEPGRALVAEAGVLATTVIGVAERAGRRWVHLDVGAFNGMMETLETRRELIFPLAWSSRGTRRLVPCAVTGPTCDSEDTMFFDVLLPDDLAAGRPALHPERRRVHDRVRLAVQRLRRASHARRRRTRRRGVASGAAANSGSRGERRLNVQATSSRSTWYALACASWIRGMCSEATTITWSASCSAAMRPPS